MGLSLPLAVYLAPAVLVLFKMIGARSFTLHHISSRRGAPKRVTRDEWLAVYRYLNISLESRNQPPSTKPGRPWRLICSGAAFATSLILLQIDLPLNIPLSFARHDWNAFPIIQVAIAGGLLASSLVLAFHRARRWRLIEHPRADYSYLSWAVLKRKRTMKRGDTP
jgi:hypothetical protein